MEVALIGLYDCDNLGDPILARCAEWLYCNGSKDITISKRLSMDVIYLHVRRNPSFLERACQSLQRRFGLKFFFESYLTWATYHYFKKELKNIDAVVFVGGGIIKYKAQYFWLFVPAIIKAAKKLGKNVILNAVGVEGYDISDYRCKRLKKALCYPNVKHISTRDDFHTLYNSFFDGHPSIPLSDVADSAVWTKEAYGIDNNAPKENKIGLGVARNNIFIDHGYNVSPYSIFNLYYDLAVGIINKGWILEIYTNGAACDQTIAFNLYNKLVEAGHSVSIKIPSSAKELIHQINGYKGIIATRLHSCIVAYSLNIPAIGLVWNEKLSLFGKKIRLEGNFIQIEEFKSEVIINRLEQALEKEYNQEVRKKFRDTIKDDIEATKHLLY